MADETATTEENTYDVKIEDIGPAKKRLTITVSADQIAEKIEQSMGTLTTQTALPGFRKGRAPKALLERRFGTTVRTETRNQIIADGYANAIEEHGIKPVGEPEPVEKIEDLQIEDGKPLTFSVDVEVVPEFDLPDLEQIEIKKPVSEVTEKNIDDEIQRQCLQFGDVEDVAADFEGGDRLFGPGKATIEGEEEPFFSHDNVDIVVPRDEDEGRGPVLGLLFEDLADRLKGVKVGDALIFKTLGPEAHELENIRGKKITIEFTIRSANRLTPATVDRIVEHYGLGSEENLREQIKFALQQRHDEEQRAAMRRQVDEHLVQNTVLDLPEKLSAAQATRMLDRQRLEMTYRGSLSADQIEARLAEMRSETEEQSARRLKLTFILQRLAEKFDVEVSDHEINGRIAAIAIQQGVRPEQLRAQLVQSGSISQIAQQIREHKASDRVIDLANVVEISAEEWNKLVTDKKAKSSKKKTSGKKTTTKNKAAADTKTTTRKSKTRKKTGEGS